MRSRQWVIRTPSSDHYKPPRPAVLTFSVTIVTITVKAQLRNSKRQESCVAFFFFAAYSCVCLCFLLRLLYFSLVFFTFFHRKTLHLFCAYFVLQNTFELPDMLRNARRCFMTVLKHCIESLIFARARVGIKIAFEYSYSPLCVS
ncbi:hypothetical protein IscW_ISCW015090 [Ixodes scapularis]|uniref:Uncharacterized protein n=1 Tax=Ixodes scapularis TaxID=6945 RepID=B7QHL0_IXOSC|nr:hypothetical protein IscW_ISCW015090 [Ixodes scapularis]|eukprot:XP_002414667.1 hypothetical protein IscW_ISCW015090 [Ixodes scapularis]